MSNNRIDIYRLIALFGVSIVISYFSNKAREQRRLEKIKEDEMINKDIENLLRDFHF